MKIEFPSGQVIYLEPLIHPRFPADPTKPKEKPKRVELRKNACEHLGGLLAATTCNNRGPMGGVWACNVFEKCAPLALVSLSAPACATCSKYEASSEPGLVKLWKTYRQAKRAWHDAGYPVRTQERVNELLKICKACPHLVTERSGAMHCGECGCPINDKTDGTKNKLFWATESCPLNPPRWTAEPVSRPASPATK